MLFYDELLYDELLYSLSGSCKPYINRFHYKGINDEKHLKYKAVEMNGDGSYGGILDSFELKH